MAKKIYNKDFKDCYFVLLNLYEAVNKRTMFYFLEGVFKFKHGESPHNFKSLRVQVKQELDDVEAMEEREKRCFNKHSNIFKAAAEIFDVESLIDDMNSGKLKDNIESLIADKNVSINQVKVGEAQVELLANWRKKEGEILGTDKSLVARVIDEINNCKKMMFTTGNVMEENKVLIADYFSYDFIRVFYLNSKGEKKSSVLELNKVVDVSNTLREKSYVSFIENLVVIRNSNKQFVFEKETDL